jgi:hypothetical protein
MTGLLDIKHKYIFAGEARNTLTTSPSLNQEFECNTTLIDTPSLEAEESCK